MSHADAVHPSAQLRATTLQSPAAPALGPRALALGIDALSFVVAAPFLLGVLAVVLREYWAVGAVALVAVYTIVAWAACGQTLGMAVAGVVLLDERTRRGPSLGQVCIRTALTLPPLVGAMVLLNDLFMPAHSGLAAPAMRVAMSAAAMGVVSALWGVIDHGRLLHDRLCGVVVVHAS